MQTTLQSKASEGKPAQQAERPPAPAQSLKPERAEWVRKRHEEERQAEAEGRPWKMTDPTAEQLYAFDARGWLDAQPRVHTEDPRFIAAIIAETLLDKFRIDKATALRLLKGWNRETDDPIEERELESVFRDLYARNLKERERREELECHYGICPQADEVGTSDPSLYDSLIEGILLRYQAMMFGAPLKTLKTTIGADFGVSLASATRFLGRFNVPTRLRVLVLLGETARLEYSPKLRACCEARGIELKTVLPWLTVGYKLPRLHTKRGHEELKQLIKSTEAKVVILDPAYKLFGVKGGMNAANLYQMGSLFSRAAQTCLECWATPVLVHHAGRDLQPGRPMQLTDLLYSGAGEFSRQWILLNRAEAYDPRRPGKHQLIMTYGSSSYPGGVVKLDIDEGEVNPDGSGRRWEVRAGEYGAGQDPPKGKKAPTAAKGRPSRGGKASLVLDAVRELGGAGREVRRKDVQSHTKLGGKALTDAIRELKKAGSIALREERKESNGKVFTTHWIRLI